ncbi:MAG: C69 family dipeptidase, partial [Anaerolineales bacterium]|nr:C69 family dipeptidase [Anaerolineales bacterium]
GPALIGMDLLRLALERATTAQDAVQVITDLLATHGQGGDCGFAHKLFYHNGFVIADPHDAWVLETAGPHWAAKQVKTVYAMSNGITIGSEWELASPDLVNYAIEQGWCKGRDDFHFGNCYSDFLYTRFSDCRGRCRRATTLLTEHTGRIDVPFIMAALRDHQVSEHEREPGNGLTGASVCMHAGFGPARSAQTTGSLVAHLHPEQPTFFFTGTAAPCTSIFKPIWLDAGVPEHGPAPAGTYEEASLFWRHESLHRATLQEYEGRLGLYRPERDELEAAFVAEALAAAKTPPANRAELSADAFATAAAAEARWLDRVAAQPIQQSPGRLYQRAWRGFNREARFPG